MNAANFALKLSEKSYRHPKRSRSEHRHSTVRPVLAPIYQPNPCSERRSNPFSDSFKALDFSHSGMKGVGYAPHQSPLKEVIYAHPTRPDDTGFGPFRATVLKAPLAARSGATGGRHPRSGRKDRKFCPAETRLPSCSRTNVRSAAQSVRSFVTKASPQSKEVSKVRG